MSSDQITEIKDNLNQLRLVRRRKVKTESKRFSKKVQKHVSFLDAYNRSLNCEKVKIPSVNEDDHNTTVAKRAYGV